MASVLHVNAITGTTGVGSQTGSPIQLSGDTVTLSGAGVTFPAGCVIQTQYDSYSTQTTIGDTNTYILTATFNTKGANSRILVLTNLLYGASGDNLGFHGGITMTCLLYTSPSPRDRTRSRMPSSA